MKTPITYYGGKQNLAKTIIALIPPHKLYCEPFFGGGAVFFAKEPSEIEVINNTNGEVMNFYEVVKTDFAALEREVSISLHSRKLHEQARIVYNNPEMFDKVKRAWAFWYLANASFFAKLDSSFGYDCSANNVVKKLAKKRDNFTEAYVTRLKETQIECRDAIKVIQSRDTAKSFFYCDPPYVGTIQGHYRGYTQEAFDNLLNTLANIKGKFLLSSFPNKSLDAFIKQNGWHTRSVEMAYRANSNNRVKTTKTEVLTANYPLVAENLFTELQEAAG